MSTEKSTVHAIIDFCNDHNLEYKFVGTLIKIFSGRRNILINVLPAYFAPNLVVVDESNQVQNVSMFEVKQILSSFM